MYDLHCHMLGSNGGFWQSQVLLWNLILQKSTIQGNNAKPNLPKLDNDQMWLTKAFITINGLTYEDEDT